MAEQREHALGLAVERRHGAKKRRLLVERLAGVGAEGRGDAQDLVLDERRARGVPCGIAARLEGGAQAAVGEARRIRLALDERLAGELGDRRAVVVGLEEAVVLLARDARERLEPVRVVRGPVEQRPFLHGVRHGVGHVQVERLALLDGRGELLVHIFRKPALHDVFGEHLGSEAGGEVGHTELPSRRPRRARPVVQDMLQITHASLHVRFETSGQQPSKQIEKSSTYHMPPRLHACEYRKGAHP